MGDRANVTIRGSEWGVYLHWDGCIARVDALTTYCRLREIRCEGDPSYGIARLAWVAGCWTGAENGLSVGICHADDDPGDNGTYVAGSDWRIVEWTMADLENEDGGREWSATEYTAFGPDGETARRCIVCSDREAVRRMVRDIDAHMPAEARLGELLDPWMAGEATEADVADSLVERTSRRVRERYGFRPEIR